MKRVQGTTLVGSSAPDTLQAAIDLLQPQAQAFWQRAQHAPGRNMKAFEPKFQVCRLQAAIDLLEPQAQAFWQRAQHIPGASIVGSLFDTETSHLKIEICLQAAMDLLEPQVQAFWQRAQHAPGTSTASAFSIQHLDARSHHHAF